MCARVAGGELEAAATTVPTSPTEVQAMFVGFDDNQPQVHEVGSSTKSEVHITSMKCSCERCKLSSLSAAPSSSVLLRFVTSLGFVGTAANLTCFGDLLRPLGDCCGFVGTTSQASKSCADTWKTAIASLAPPPIPSASRSGQGESQSQKKRRVTGTVLRKPAAQSRRLPRSPFLVRWRGPFTLVRRGKSQSRLAEAYMLQRRGTLPRWVAGQSESRSQHFWKT